MRASLQLMSLFAIAGLIGLAYFGAGALERIRLRGVATFLPWVTFGITLVVVANAIMNVMSIMSSHHDAGTPGFALLLAIPVNLLAAFDSSRSAWRVDRSLEAVSPPEISHRLTEALKYLD